jgi:16S rRNA (cytidine1402-2'-O)-methyltransferase
MSKGTLYIVSTPIGNLEDITLRALRILKEVDVIAAEDTRHSIKLLNHYGISKPLISYWGEKEKVRAEETLGMLNSGKSVALVSDAGTPGISDPGNILIKKALDEGIDVVPVPGPTAIITALSMSGLPSSGFVFVGFLPLKQSFRTRMLKDLSLESRTIVIYEAPHRIMDTMVEMEEIFGERNGMLVKELTKLFEETYRGTPGQILDQLENSKIAGEYVIVIEGRNEDDTISMEDALTEMRALMKKGIGRKEASKKIAGEYGLSRKELYDKSLD